MNFNFFVNTQQLDGVVPSEQLALVGAVEGTAEAAAPLPVEQLEAMMGGAGEGAMAVGEADLAPMSEEALASLGAEAGAGMEAEAPLPIAQLEAMIGGTSEGALAVGESELTPMSEEALAALGADDSLETQVAPPLTVEELEAMATGGDALPGLVDSEPAPMSEEELASLEETGPPPVPSSAGDDAEATSDAKPRARSRAKRKAQG